ncbi:hypothetical protein [Cytobacillus horneckiae]|uniref:hypothetical protein n=1 Tax=Cytobacillus horneckiae TaxID=549687 RepID=UPI003D9A9674
MYDIEVLSLYEYSMRMKAFNLARIDKEHEMHQQAWINQKATATKKQGDKFIPVYKEFKDFYDFNARLRELEAPKKSRLTTEQRKMAKIAASVNARGEVK